MSDDKFYSDLEKLVIAEGKYKTCLDAALNLMDISPIRKNVLDDFNEARVELEVCIARFKNA